MKFKGCKSLYTTKRDRELYHAYLQELSEAEHINIREICRRVVLRPCSQYWISEERAGEIIRQLENGIPIRDVVKGKKCYKSTNENSVYVAMITELYDVYRRMKNENPRSSIFELTTLAVNSRASQFFITPESARKFIYRYRRCQEIMSRLRHHASFVSPNKK